MRWPLSPFREGHAAKLVKCEKRGEKVRWRLVQAAGDKLAWHSGKRWMGGYRLGKLGNVMLQACELAICSHARSVCVGRRGSHIIVQDWRLQGKRSVWRGGSGGRSVWRRRHRRRIIVPYLRKRSSFLARMGLCLLAGELAKIGCHGRTRVV